MVSIQNESPAVSPFDSDGVQFAWDSTSLGLLKTCPRLYQLSMLENWQPKTTSVHLVFGIHYHKALERYQLALATGESREDSLRYAVRECLRDTADWSSEDPDKNRWTLLRSIIWHCEHYAEDPARTVVLANGKPAVELTFRFEIGEGFYLCGHLDRIVDFGDGRYVMDHKTAKAKLSSHYFKNYNPDNQMTLYTLAGSIAFNQPVKGVLIDGAQVAVGFTEFARDITVRSKDQLDEFVEGVYAWRGVAAHYQRTGFWPMNETACDKYGGCRFRDVCGTRNAARERILQTYFTQEGDRWNPLQPR